MQHSLYPQTAFPAIEQQPHGPHLNNAWSITDVIIYSFSHSCTTALIEYLAISLSTIVTLMPNHCSHNKKVLVYGHAPFQTVYWITKEGFHGFGSMHSCCNNSFGFLHPLNQIFIM